MDDTQRHTLTIVLGYEFNIDFYNNDDYYNPLSINKHLLSYMVKDGVLRMFNNGKEFIKESVSKIKGGLHLYGGDLQLICALDKYGIKKHNG